MTEATAIGLIKSVCDQYIKGYEIHDVDTSRGEGRTQHETTFAIISRSGGMTSAMIEEMTRLEIDNGGEIEFVRKYKEIDDLKTDIMLVKAIIEIGGL